jgi:hypothetical protein
MNKFDLHYWIETDETMEAINALEMLYEILLQVPENPYYWKWAIIVIHNTLQNFMVLALTDCNITNILEKSCKEKWIANNEHQSREKPIKLKLASFLDLYTRIKSDEMKIKTISKVFTPSGTQDYSIRKINRFRNNFIHFIPKSWLIEKSGLPKIFLDAVSIIKFLVEESGNIFWYKDENEKRTTNLVNQIFKQLTVIKTKYETEETLENCVNCGKLL